MERSVLPECLPAVASSASLQPLFSPALADAPGPEGVASTAHRAAHPPGQPAPESTPGRKPAPRRKRRKAQQQAPLAASMEEDEQAAEGPAEADSQAAAPLASGRQMKAPGEEHQSHSHCEQRCSVCQSDNSHYQ